MKTKIYLLSLFLSFMLTAFSQPYRSYFGKEFTRWYVFGSFYDIGMTDMYETLNIDTIIDDKVYKKAFYSIYSYSIYFEEHDMCMREETETGRLYVREYGPDGKEHLVSDMSLLVGDTFRLTSPFVEDYLGSSLFRGIEKDEAGYYTLIDSVYYKEDRKHIRTQIYLKGWLYVEDYHLEFIEGIGSSFGFNYYVLHPMFPNYLELYLTCYETEDLLWKNLDFWHEEKIPNLGSDCFYNYDASGIESADKKHILKMKQEADNITLSFEDAISGRIVLYDLLGKALIATEIQNEDTVIIPLWKIPQGNYLLCVFDKSTGKILAREKITKN